MLPDTPCIIKDIIKPDGDGATVSTHTSKLHGTFVIKGPQHQASAKEIGTEKRTLKRHYYNKRADDANDKRIRYRYFHRLGLPEPSQPSLQNIMNSSRKSSSCIAVKALKNDNDSEKARRSVSFEPKVVVWEIPNRLSYSLEMKQAIWPPPAEFAEAVKRNTVEFMSEGCDPKGVIEEEDFVQQNEKLVHPAHATTEYSNILKLWRFSLTF